jgi:hypothetical protein
MRGMNVKSIDELLTEFATDPTHTRRRGYCKTAKWLDIQEPKLRDKILKVLTDSNIGLDIKNFRKALIENGHSMNIGETAFRDHFKGRCTCRK